MKPQFSHASDTKIRSGSRFSEHLKLMQFPEGPYIRAILVNTLAMSLLTLAIPLSIQSVTNILISRTMKQPLVMLSLVLLCVLCFTSMLQVIQTFTTEMLKRRIFVRFGLVISERMTHYKEEAFRPNNHPSLINRYFDTLIMQSSMVTFFVEGFGFAIMFGTGFTLLIFYHPYFVVFALGMVIFLVANWLLFGPSGVAAGSPEADAKYAVVSWVEELSRARNMFSSNNGRAFSNQKILQAFNEWLVKRNRLFTCQFRQHIGLQIFNVTINVVLLFMGGYMVLEGELSIGQLVAAALVVSNISASIPRLQSFFLSVYDYSTALDKIAEFYDYPLEKDTSKLPAPPSYQVEFRNVRVSPNYHFDFEIPAERRILIVIKSYSSIDMMYDLMMGFVSPAYGSVYLGGKHIDDVNVALFRDQVQVIRQDQYFSGTVRENIQGISGNQAEMSAMQDALERLGMWDFIQSLEDKLDTHIRPNGYPFSRSQLLTLQVARALLNHPKILFVTPDLEQISTYKRRRVFKELFDSSRTWTLLFFTQKIYNANFDLCTYLDRRGLHTINDQDDASHWQSDDA